MVFFGYSIIFPWQDESQIRWFAVKTCISTAFPCEFVYGILSAVVYNRREILDR